MSLTSTGCNAWREGTWGTHASSEGAVHLSMALLSTCWKAEEITDSPRPVWSQPFPVERGWSALLSLEHVSDPACLCTSSPATCNCGCTEANSILCSFLPSINIYLSHTRGNSKNRALCLPGEWQLQTCNSCGTFLGRSLTLPLEQALLVGQAEEHLACDCPGEGDV